MCCLLWNFFELRSFYSPSFASIKDWNFFHLYDPYFPSLAHNIMDIKENFENTGRHKEK